MIIHLPTSPAISIGLRWSKQEKNNRNAPPNLFLARTKLATAGQEWRQGRIVDNDKYLHLVFSHSNSPATFKWFC